MPLVVDVDHDAPQPLASLKNIPPQATITTSFSYRDYPDETFVLDYDEHHDQTTPGFLRILRIAPGARLAEDHRTPCQQIFVAYVNPEHLARAIKDPLVLIALDLL